MGNEKALTRCHCSHLDLDAHSVAAELGVGFIPSSSQSVMLMFWKCILFGSNDGNNELFYLWNAIQYTFLMGGLLLIQDIHASYIFLQLIWKYCNISAFVIPSWLGLTCLIPNPVLGRHKIFGPRWLSRKRQWKLAQKSSSLNTSFNSSSIQPLFFSTTSPNTRARFKAPSAMRGDGGRRKQPLSAVLKSAALPETRLSSALAPPPPLSAAKSSR